jgi:hypothetical protein
MLFLTDWSLPYRRVRLPALPAGGRRAFPTHFAGPAGVLPVAVPAALTCRAGRTRNRRVFSFYPLPKAPALIDLLLGA